MKCLMPPAIGAQPPQNAPNNKINMWQAEQEVINSGLPYTILRPSLIFGEGDEFINALAALVKAFPLVPVVGRW